MIKLKSFTHYGVTYNVGLNNTPAGHYYVERRGMIRYFDDSLIFDYCDDEENSWKRVWARRNIVKLFK